MTVLLEYIDHLLQYKNPSTCYKCILQMLTLYLCFQLSIMLKIIANTDAWAGPYSANAISEDHL